MEQVSGSDAMCGAQRLSAPSRGLSEPMERIDVARNAIQRWTAPLRIALAPIPCKVLPQGAAGLHN